MLDIVVAKLLYLLKNVIPVLVIAIVIANILSEFGVIRRISFIFKPLIRFANLSEESALAVVTYLASGSAAMAMLAGFREQRVISERETVIAAFVSSFFSFVNHLFVYFIPVVIPLLGLTAGMLYITARLFVSMCVTATAVIAGHFLLSGEVRARVNNKTEANERTPEEKIRAGLKQAWNVLKKILPRLVVVYVITALLNAYGFFEPLKEIHVGGFPGEASAIIAVGLADTTSAFALAGSMLAEGMLTPVEAVSALLLTSIVTMSVVLVRHSLPGRIAYFGVKLGFKIAVLSALLNVTYTIVALALLLYLT
ncbi:nucleoside recognition domain-containing protein [Archaeoglobus veneficus]|uniref:Nucleoside recognition domain protein n=1 Tax=Archaeoglobus veneficus (strain DSM 11195 / SNP6) TaxID=693661 RepID=F2KP92_ARCVS|nr:nucleoside recognition domain-containing protein [Archaeoglobus veneficus]AEA47496.1 nucleoside recognition domain protein [Archaeoglobus veneficus SNP6]